MGILMNSTTPGTKKWLINFYQEQLDYFIKVGLGNYTTHNTKVTKDLLACTRKRLNQLTLVYEAKLTPQALKLRKLKEKRLNGQHKHNGATVTSRMQNNGNPRHAKTRT